jgi:hypothetical protein
MTTQNINQAKKMDDTHLSREELEAAVLGLSDVDIRRVASIAKTYTGNHDMEADDMVNEAVLRTLSGERKACPRDLPIVNFLAGAIRSIANGEREKKDPARELRDIELDQLHESDSNPENMMLEKQLFEELEVIFEEDEEILLLILYLQDGASPSEIQENEGWTETQYNSIRRRMRRKWNAHTEQEKTS